MELHQLIYVLGQAHGGMLDWRRREALSELIRQGKLNPDYLRMQVLLLEDVLRHADAPKPEKGSPVPGD